jgi:hypothetical protein
MSDYEELRAEIAALRAQVRALAGGQAATPPAEDEPVSRRGLLGKLAGAAVAGAGLSMLGTAPAEAAAGGNLVLGASNDAGAEGTSLKNLSSETTFDTWQQGTGICVGADITHTTSTSPVIWARHNGYGSVIDAAVLNSDSQAACITGWSSIGTGVQGTGYQGVRGESTNGIGVHAIDYDTGRGLNAYSNLGDAISGYSNGGYGAWLTGGKAPLRLEPHGSDGPPTGGLHGRGEVMVDVNGTVWVCLTGGTPGTWVRPGFNPLVKRLVSSGTTTGSYAAAQKKDVTATGVPAGVTAVALNITATSTGSGSVTVYPYGATRPGVAHLAVNPQYRWTGFAIVQLGSGGRFSVYNSSGTTKMSIDLAGFFA